MTMHINFSAEMEGFIKSQVASGFYGNATEVIRDAVRRMQVEESRIAAWQSAVRQGDEQLDRGEGTIYDAEALEEIARNAVASQHSGLPINPDVLP